MALRVSWRRSWLKGFRLTLVMPLIFRGILIVSQAHFWCSSDPSNRCKHVGNHQIGILVCIVVGPPHSRCTLRCKEATFPTRVPRILRSFALWPLRIECTLHTLLVLSQKYHKKWRKYCPKNYLHWFAFTAKTAYTLHSGIEQSKLYPDL